MAMIVVSTGVSFSAPLNSLQCKMRETTPALTIHSRGFASTRLCLALHWSSSSAHRIVTSYSHQRPEDEIKSNAAQEREAGTWLGLQPWDVPWDYGLTAAGILAWVASFLVSGFVVSLGSEYLGIERRQLLELDEQAGFILISQILQTIVGLSTVAVIVNKYQPLPSDLFRYDLKQPFDLQRGWLLWGGVGALSAGGAVYLTSLLTTYLTGEPLQRESTDALLQLLPIIGASPLSTASLITVTGVLAPLLEETVFRGFLMASLTKRLPVAAAVVISSAVFAIAHLAPNEFPQLFALGLVMGFAYAKTHNLLTPILIHSVWNSGVVVVLTLLRLQGYDLQELL